MWSRFLGFRNGICLLGTFLIALHGESQPKRLPKLGDSVPAYVLTTRVHGHQCLTDIKHYDPCASVKIQKKTFTIAWDATSKQVTYIFSNDTDLEDDSELGVGGSCRLVDEFEHPEPTARYRDWLISPMWSASFQDLSGDTVWYVLMRRKIDFPQYGDIVGFVQSRYLKLPNDDARIEPPAH